MKFISWLPKEVEGQTEELLIVRDIRTIDDPKKVPMHLGRDEWWYNEGQNHRIENGYIVRDRVELRRTFEVEDLNQMMELAKQFVGLVIDFRPEYELPSISVYDPDDC